MTSQNENTNVLPTSFQQFVHLSRYARWNEEKGRRETWQETVDRYVNHMCDKQCPGKIPPEVREEIRSGILNLEVMPSMRCLMTAGEALEKTAIAAYNCCFVAIDDPKVFDEILLILMCGTGVGISVERQFICHLPVIAEKFRRSNTVISVEDSREGWANAFRELISMLYAGCIPSWDTSKVRPAGARLKTFGGRASGPGPLIELFQFTVDTFKEAAGRKLNSVECHDICCKIGEIVICGGVRRCLPGGTPVFTVNGPKAISEIVVGDEVVSGGKRGKVVSAGYSGMKKTIIIRHRFGEIESTPEHRVAVFNSIMEYEFKEAKDIVIGDRLVWDTVGYDGRETALPELEKEELHFNAKLPTIPALTTEVAWFFGLFHGDGCVSPKSLEIAGNTREMETLRRASVICKAAFNLDSSVGSDGRSGAGARMRVSSTVLSKWFHSHIKQANVPIRIPRFIFEAKREIRFAYLAGLLDADGRIRKDGRIDQTCTVYQQFAEEVVTLLAGLGIGAVTFPGSAKKRRDRGENAQDFWNISIVGNTNRKMFYDGCKKFSLKIASKILGFSSPIDFSFPIRWGGSFLGYKSNGNISVMSMRYNLPLLPTRVISILEGREVKTYDIQVGGIERFTANGLVVHNSAIISLSNPSDDRMRYAKSGEWWKANPHRALANISACYTEKPGMDVFMREWLALYDSKSGERGIFNREAAKKNCAKYGRRDPNHDFGSNPCSEVIARSAEFCNLTEVIARPGDAEETLKRKVRLATIMGTMQATITNFTYLRKIWRQNTEEEALLGVSITGVLDNVLLSGAEGKKKLGETLGRLREYAVSVNKEWAAKLGINQATATTCVKPSGCATLDTKIKTGGGIKSFAEIFAMNMVNPIGLRDGMWIQPTTETIVYDENNLPAKVTKFYINGMAEVYEIEDDKGNVYKFTGNHRLKTTNGWRRVDKLTEDDEIIEFI